VHRVGTVAAVPAAPGPYDGHAQGLTRRVLIGASDGSLHQTVAVCELEPGGRVESHFHPFEEAVYVLAGELSLHGERLGPDAFCWTEAEVAHEVRNDGAAPVRWLEVAAPLPGNHDEAVFGRPGREAERPCARGRFEQSQLPEPSGGIGLAGWEGANVSGGAAKVIVGPELGASQLNLMVVRYVPGAFIREHDHPFEEGFLFVEGEMEAELDGERYTLRAGDYCFTGVSSLHGLENRSAAPAVWLETQIPQPPPRHQVRFVDDWRRLTG
jgi:quercetin dioxygenase-like cupin family protein